MQSELKISRALRSDGHGPQPALAQYQVADLIVAYLVQIGVSHIFGVPGDVIDSLAGALMRADRRCAPQAIIARDAAGAAFMADGYARETGKLGVCCAASGSGAPNLVTAVACAHENGVPLLLLTGQPSLPLAGKRSAQQAADREIDALFMFRSCTRYNTLVSDASQVENKLTTALQKALEPFGGPVHLGFSIGVLRSSVADPVPAQDLSAFAQPSAATQQRAFMLRAPVSCTPVLRAPVLDAPVFRHATRNKPTGGDMTPITPHYLLHDMSRRLPSAVRYLADFGNSLIWATSYLQTDERRAADRYALQHGRQYGEPPRHGGRLRVASGFAPIGYAIGAAVGTAAGNPNLPVVCITGDGGMLMAGQEISVAKAERLTVIYVVLNETITAQAVTTRTAATVASAASGTGGAIHAQNALHRQACTIDFAAIARSLGIDAYVINNRADLQTIDFDALCRRGGPTLLDVHIAPDDVPQRAAAGRW